MRIRLARREWTGQGDRLAHHERDRRRGRGASRRQDLADLLYMEKDGRYRELVGRRQACGCCGALENPSRIDGGRFDSDCIGPYSRWQGNLNAELMVVAQDFADVEGFRRHRGWPGERVRTNVALTKLVALAGIEIQAPRHGVADECLFFTNAVLCMKRGGMRAPIPESCVSECGKRFLRPLIELVAPKVVVSLGIKAAAAVCQAFEIASPANLRQAAAVPIRLAGPTVLMPLYHPAASRSHEAQQADWKQVREMLNQSTVKRKQTEHWQQAASGIRNDQALSLLRGLI